MTGRCLLKVFQPFRGLLQPELDVLQPSAESSMPSIQNNKQYHFELTGNLGCLEFLTECERPESSETGPVLTGL